MPTAAASHSSTRPAVDERRHAWPQRHPGGLAHPRKAYLIAFLDDATRVVPYCAFALAESTQAVPAGVQAGPHAPWHPRAPLRRQTAPTIAPSNWPWCAPSWHRADPCQALSTFGQGQAGAIFSYVRSQLLPTLSEADTASLQALNRRLWAWVETEYHHHPQPRPGRRHAAGPLAAARAPRLPEPDLDLDALFLFEAKRRVQRDHTVSLNGTAFEVDAALVGQTVTLPLRPSIPAGDGIEVWHEGPHWSLCASRWTDLRQLLRASAPPHPDHRALEPTVALLRPRPRASARWRCATCAPCPATPTSPATPSPTPTTGSRADVPATLRPDPFALRAFAPAR